MKKILSLILSAAVASTGISPLTRAQETTEEANWVLAWSDEFEGDSLDMTKWSYELGNWLLDNKGNYETSGWGNNEQEFYTDKNALVENGTLTIQAKKETYTDAVQGTYEYTSSKLVTKNKFSMCLGKVEIRARVDSGRSLWPALWMLPENSVYGRWAASGEIDIMEGFGSTPEKICGTIHFGNVWPENKYLTEYYYFKDGDSTENWHTYSIEWEEDEIRWYVDDVLYSTQNNWYLDGRTYPAPFDQNFYLIMNLAVGGHFDGVDGIYADPAIFENGPKELEVDYVRVYQKDGITKKPAELQHMTMKPYFMEGGTGTASNSDNGTMIEISDTGSQTYSVMAAVESLDIKKEQKYTLDFDILSTVPRDIELTIENYAYDRFFDKKITLTEEPQHFHYECSFENDEKADIKFLLGKTDENISSGHKVLISGLRWSVCDEADDAFGDLNSDGICDITDLSMLSLYLLDDMEFSKSQLKTADINSDERINLSDLAQMKRFLMRK